MKLLKIFYLSIILIIFSNCQKNTNLDPKIDSLFKDLTKYYHEKDKLGYYNTLLKITNYHDSTLARAGLLYYFFEYPYRGETFLYKIQADVKRLGFYEDWEVLDRFYARYRERYSREAVAKDSSLVDVHQAYIQFLAVCNYEKIKPLYLQELSETIRSGDYTYAFNSYLLPEHWEEAADTLMKYYWSVKDEDTKEKINKAVVQIKKEKGFDFYQRVCEEEKNPVVIKMMMAAIYGDELKYKGQSLYEYLKRFIKDKSLRRFYHVEE